MGTVGIKDPGRLCWRLLPGGPGTAGGLRKQRSRAGPGNLPSGQGASWSLWPQLFPPGPSPNSLGLPLAAPRVQSTSRKRVRATRQLAVLVSKAGSGERGPRGGRAPGAPARVALGGAPAHGARGGARGLDRAGRCGWGWGPPASGGQDAREMEGARSGRRRRRPPKRRERGGRAEERGGGRPGKEGARRAGGGRAD